MEYGPFIGLFLALIAGAVAYGRLQGKIDALSTDNANIWKVITKIRDEMTAHEKESATVRRDIDRDIQSVREIALKNDGRWEEVLRRLGNIDSKIDQLETRDEKRP